MAGGVLISRSLQIGGESIPNRRFGHWGRFGGFPPPFSEGPFWGSRRGPPFGGAGGPPRDPPPGGGGAHFGGYLITLPVGTEFWDRIRDRPAGRPIPIYLGTKIGPFFGIRRGPAGRGERFWFSGPGAPRAPPRGGPGPPQNDPPKRPPKTPPKRPPWIPPPNPPKTPLFGGDWCIEGVPHLTHFWLCASYHGWVIIGWLCASYHR